MSQQNACSSRGQPSSDVGMTVRITDSRMERDIIDEILNQLPARFEVQRRHTLCLLDIDDKNWKAKSIQLIRITQMHHF